MAKVSCRKAFTSTLLEQARKDPSLWAVATDSRGSVTIGQFFQELPEQSVELGIAEQNAVSAAAGIAATGKNVFVTGPACFLAARSYEQVKVDVAYNESNVKVIGVSGGVSYGPLGGTHTSLHDIAGMRALPNIEVFVPSDAAQTRAITRYIINHNGPCYMRTGRGDVEGVYPENEDFGDVHKAKLVMDGTDVAIIACGEMVYFAKQAGEILRGQGIRARVLDLCCLKPADEPAIAAARDTGAIVTVEEHSIFGGLGELVAHVTARECPVPVDILGFPDEEYKVGKNQELFAYYGLTPENIAARAVMEEKR